MTGLQTLRLVAQLGHTQGLAMSIRVICPSCGRGGRVPDEALGKPVKCPGCGLVYTLQHATSSVEGIPLVEPPAPPVAPATSRGKRAADTLDLYGLGQEGPPLAPADPVQFRPSARAPQSSTSTDVLPVVFGACAGAVVLVVGIIAFVNLWPSNEKTKPDHRPLAASRETNSPTARRSQARAARPGGSMSIRNRTILARRALALHRTG
jgi:hypothetical protein